MNAASLTYFLGVLFWAVTAFHGVLSSQAFIEEQFLAPRLFAPLAAFTDWHDGIAILTFAAWAAARYREFSRPSPRIWAAAIAWLAATVLLATVFPLSGRHTTATALLVVGGGVGMILLLGLAEWRACDETVNPAPDRSRADLIACLLAAAAVTVAQVGATASLDGVAETLVSDALPTVRLHLLLASCIFLMLSAVRGAAGLTSRPVVAETALSIVAFSGVLATYLSASVLASISIRGPLGIAMALGLGAAVAFAVGARGSEAGGVTGMFAVLSPKAVERWWGLALWATGLLALAIAAITASRAADWNFVLLRGSIVLAWVLALSAALGFSRRYSDGGARGAFAVVVLLLGAHVALESSVARVQATSLRNPSAKWIAQTLAGRVPTGQAGNLVQLLHANTNVPRDKEVAAVDVDLARLTGTPSATRPHVFMFVVDSLRRDYLSPYNPAVTFTPAIDALAKDSLVFRNAFTQYGATGLSVPSIWVGGSILHKQYVTSFPRMNSLAKLLAHEQYTQWISMDNILDVILPPSVDRVPLDAGVRVKNFRLCETLTEIRSRLAVAPQSPVFAYSLPQDVHVSVVTSEGARSIDDQNYTGFYAPVASRVRRFDACLGDFIDELKTRGLYDQSVIVLTSDHGDSLGEDGRMGHAYSLHPEVVRIPLIIHVPPALRDAWTWDETRVAYSTDITPTLYRLFGHEPTAPAAFFGESLAEHAGTAHREPKPRMIAASYGAVYGALLDRGRQYYVFDAIAMRDMAFDLGSGSAPGAERSLTPDVQERGLKVIGGTVAEIASFYRFSTTPGSAP